MDTTKYNSITGEAFLDRIDEALEKRFHTRKQLADACGFSVQNLSRWKTLGSLPDIKCGIKIADFLDVPLYWLATGNYEIGRMPIEEFQLLDGYKHLNDEDKEVIRATLSALLKKYVHAGFEGHYEVN